MRAAAICASSMSDGRQILRGAEIGVHGALAVRRHQDVGAAGGGAGARGLGLESDAGGADVVGIEGADLVGLDLADEGGAGAEAGDADDGVGAGAAAHFGRRPHILVDGGRAGLVDQRHAALGHAVAGEKALVGLHQHVENRIADPENVVFCVSHRASCLRRSRRSRARLRRLRPTRSAPRQQGKRARHRGMSGEGPVYQRRAPAVVAIYPLPGRTERERAAASCCYRVRMIRSFLTVSRHAGLAPAWICARLALAALLGAGPVADAFLAAFQLVNVASRLLTEGGLNAALVPAWLRVRETEGPTAAAAFAGRVLGTITLALIAATVLLALLMPFVITALAPGFAGRETLQLATDNARLMLPYLAFAGAGDRDDGAIERTRAICADGVLAVAVQHRADRRHGRADDVSANAVRAAQIVAATVGVAGLLQLSILSLRRGESIATPFAFRSTRKSAAFSPRPRPA